jgi:hypothetical protein
MTPRTYEAIVRQFLFVLIIGLSAAALGCQQGAEGDYCNPDLSHNECNSGLVCMSPALCPESYCCPADLTGATSPYCAEGCNGGAQAICNANNATPAEAEEEAEEVDAACQFNAKHPFDGGFSEPD